MLVPSLPFFSHVSVTKLPLSRTLLFDGQLEPVPSVSVLESVDCIIHKGFIIYLQVALLAFKLLAYHKL